MKKIVRLTESDLVKLVKRVIKEQSQDELRGMGWNADPTKDVFRVPRNVASNYNKLFRGPYMSNYDASKLVKELVKRGYSNYLQPIYIDDSEVVTTGQQGNMEKYASTQYRVGYQVKLQFKLDGQSLPINVFLNTCDNRTENCQQNILQKVKVNIGSEEFDILLS